jgi:prolipoprotein diacylglyceryl transferase
MYPNLYYAFKDLMGVDWPFLRFFNTFGFFVALAFGAAATLLAYELRRKSKQGLFRPEETTILVGEPVSLQDILFNFLLGFLLGFKLLALFLLDKDEIVDPPSFIFSTDGNLPLGILVGLFFAIIKGREKEKQRLDKPEKRIIRIWPEDRVGDITLLALVFGLAGAKLFDIFENWTDFLRRPSDYLFSPAGLTIYGGLICAATAIAVYARKHKIGFLHLGDAVAPGLMLAYGIGRLGCQLSGDGDWGIVSDLAIKPSFLPDWAWSYTYPHNVIEAGIPIPGCEGPYCNVLPEGVYPTPLYESVASITLAFVLFYLKKHVKTGGIIFSYYMIFNGLERFIVEKIRVNNQLNFLGLQPTQAEIISSLLFLTGIVLGIYLKQRHKSSVES